jgi:hypothetical protein
MTERRRSSREQSETSRLTQSTLARLFELSLSRKVPAALDLQRQHQRLHVLPGKFSEQALRQVHRETGISFAYIAQLIVPSKTGDSAAELLMFPEDNNRFQTPLAQLAIPFVGKRYEEVFQWTREGYVERFIGEDLQASGEPYDNSSGGSYVGWRDYTCYEFTEVAGPALVNLEIRLARTRVGID